MPNNNDTTNAAGAMQPAPEPRLGDRCHRCGERFGQHYGATDGDYPMTACVIDTGEPGAKAYSSSQVFQPECADASPAAAVAKAAESARLAELDLRLALKAASDDTTQIEWMIMYDMLDAVTQQASRLASISHALAKRGGG